MAAKITKPIKSVKNLPKLTAARTLKPIKPTKPKKEKKPAAGNKPTFKSLIKKKIQAGTLPESNYESRIWYRQQSLKMMSLREVSTERFKRIGRMSRRMQTTIKSRQLLGKLFMFEYDPKARDTLEYYDTFPCVFIIELYKDGFLGVNMHYLPYMWRAVLMDNLYEIMTNQNMDKTTRLNMVVNGYKILKKSVKYRHFVPCVRRYLFDNVRSRYMEVPASEWEIAIFLPLERFESGEGGGRATRKNVWMDTRKKYYKSLTSGGLRGSEKK
jgi:hypothetical protein